MSSGRLFQSVGPTEPNERSPTVTRRDGRTSSWLEVADRTVCTVYRVPCSTVCTVCTVYRGVHARYTRVALQHVTTWTQPVPAQRREALARLRGLTVSADQCLADD